MKTIHDLPLETVLADAAGQKMFGDMLAVQGLGHSCDVVLDILGVPATVRTAIAQHQSSKTMVMASLDNDCAPSLLADSTISRLVQQVLLNDTAAVSQEVTGTEPSIS